MATPHWIHKVGSLLVEGRGEKEKMQTQNSRSGNRNLTVSQGNLSSCQTSLTAAAELSAEQRNLTSTPKRLTVEESKAGKRNLSCRRICHFTGILQSPAWPHVNESNFSCQT